MASRSELFEVTGIFTKYPDCRDDFPLGRKSCVCLACAPAPLTSPEVITRLAHPRQVPTRQCRRAPQGGRLGR
jgi:hypothetical protein